MEQQRMDAAALFRAGKRVYEVAAELGVAYATAHGWKTRLERRGLAAVRSRGKPGPDKQLSPSSSPPPGARPPLLEFNFNRKRSSAIGGVSFCELWFALHEGTIRAPNPVESP